MNKKAIIVIALFFFIGNAIAVCHVGDGAEVSGANTMVSDEDDYQKEIIAKFGDLYFDSSENPEETTSGMAMWCTQQEKRYKNNVALYSAKLGSLPLQPILKDCLKQETDCWNKLQASLNKFDAIYTSVWSKELQEALATVKYETQDKKLIKSYGSASEYKQLYCQLEKYAVDTKTLLARWVTQRRNAEQLLSESQPGNYRNHTLLGVNALAYHLYNNRML